MIEFPPRVTVTEVVLRDGLQSFDRFVSTDDKLQILDHLVAAGFRSIEVTSFSHPEAVPHLRDAEELLSRVDVGPDIELRALVPNLRGMQRAHAAGVRHVVALLTATESYSRKNQRRGVHELVEMAGDVVQYGAEHGVAVDVGVGTAFFDPYEGPTDPLRVERIVATLHARGARRFYVATSAGMADPRQVSHLCRRLLSAHPDIELGIHLHDTNGMALANALVAMDAGVRRLESSICGIGGGMAMPHRTQAVGNLATEDLVHMLTLIGIETGLDAGDVVDAARRVADLLHLTPASRSLNGGRREDVRVR